MCLNIRSVRHPIQAANPTPTRFSIGGVPLGTPLILNPRRRPSSSASPSMLYRRRSGVSTGSDHAEPRDLDRVRSDRNEAMVEGLGHVEEGFYPALRRVAKSRFPTIASTHRGPSLGLARVSGDAGRVRPGAAGLERGAAHAVQLARGGLSGARLAAPVATGPGTGAFVPVDVAGEGHAVASRGQKYAARGGFALVEGHLGAIGRLGLLTAVRHRGKQHPKQA